MGASSLGMAAMRTCERQAASTLVSSTPAGTSDLSNKNNLTLLKAKVLNIHISYCTVARLPDE
jgi:hypothetical protein